ncbi:hypothetical protein K440DRAFT_682389 [Wilcoxina mikolae CBS 423.85]|nr:hypothetical protein K440DRAFT_682389 [Wilcoxina mikolae CBS 423.85]
MHSFARLTLSTRLYGTATAKTLDKRSTDGNTGLSGGEIAGLVVGIVGVILTAMTVFIGWKYRKGLWPSPPTTFTNYFHTSPSVPVQDVSLDTVRTQHQIGLTHALLHTAPSRPHTL